MRKITKLRRSIRAISPIIATLLLIAIAVVASLVAYAWIMGYLGSTTSKAGDAIQIQSFASLNGYLTVYVQNVGQGSVDLKPTGSAYVNSTLYLITQSPSGTTAPNPIPIPIGQTIQIVTNTPYTPTDYVTIKIVTTGGTFAQTSGTGGGAAATPPPSTPAASFVVSGFTNSVTAGTSGTVTVTAKEANGDTATGYSGTVKITSSDGAATLPANSKLTDGVGIFSVTLVTAGSQSITASDTTTSSITGSQTGITVNPATATSLAITPGTATVAAGISQSYTATATDKYGNSWDATSSASFSASGASVLGNSVIATVANVYSVTASLDGVTSNTAQLTVTPAAATHFVVSGFPSTTVAGVANSVTVTAYDASGNVATGYTGTVAITSTDGNAVLPADSTLTNGVGTFSVTLVTAGSQSITATDTTTSSITGSQTGITVTAAAASKLAVSGFTSPQVAGAAFSITVTAQDKYGNTVTAYTGSATLSDLSSSINPTSITLSAGVWTGQVTIKTAIASDVITATASTIEGQSILFTVNTGPLATFAFSTVGTQTAGTTFSVTITAQDSSGNTITGYTGPATLTDSSGSLNPTTTGAFTNGVWTGSLNITKAMTGDVITATDPSSGVTGHSNAFTINSNVLATFVFNPISSQTAGKAFSITITAQDEFGNTITSYTGSVSFTDLSGSLTLVTSGSFANGVYTGSVEITKAYTNDVVTATDASTGLTGSSNEFTVAAGAATQLVYTAGAGQTLPISTVSGVITVQLQDANGNPVNAASAVTVTLSSSYPTTATFYSTPTTKITTTPITITIAAGSSSASFYFSDTQYESPVITASATGLTSATTTLTVTQYKLIFVPSTASEPVGVGATAIQVERETTGGTQYGVGSITVQLSTSSSTGYFATLSGGVYTKITQIAISNGYYYGANTFYYIDTTAGTATLTAACPGYTSGTATFTIYAPVLTSFAFSTISSPQATGKAFSVTITALDQNGNTMTSYTGTNTLSASTGTISPTSTGAFTAGVWTGSVTLNTASTTMTISTSGGGVTGTSNSFTVYAPVISSFRIGNIGTQTAGTAFSVTITAYDQDGNVLTNYAGPYTLTDSTGTLTSTGSFTNGVLTASVTITKASTDDVITVTDTGTGVHAASNEFTVNHAATAATITVSPSSASISAGNTETYTATATDTYGNTWSATTSVTWSISSSAGGSWSYFDTGVYTSEYAGTWTVTATLGSTKGTASLTVTALTTVSQFAFSTISSPQTAGTAFSVTITAEDEYGNTVTTYTGTNTLTVSTGTITPTTTTAFVAGVWTGSITLTKSGNNVYVSTTGSGRTGISNTFTVNAGSATRLVFTVEPTYIVHNERSTVFTVTLEDANGNAVTATSTITVTLTASTGSNGLFYASASSTTAITSVTIASGSSSASFYYQTSTTGSQTITASSGTLTSATATYTAS